MLCSLADAIEPSCDRCRYFTRKSFENNNEDDYGICFLNKNIDGTKLWVYGYQSCEKFEEV